MAELGDNQDQVQPESQETPAAAGADPQNAAETVGASVEAAGASPDPAAPSRLRKRTIAKWSSLYLLLLALMVGLGVVGGIYFGKYVLWQGAQFETLKNLESYKPKLYTKIHDRNGILLATISYEKRVMLDFENIPEDFVNSLVALEDKDFFHHIGVSPLGILSAIKDNILRGTMRGASTLTQQLVKNITKKAETSLERKLKEQFLAVQLESRFTKEEIFAMYANEVPFGNNQFGIVAAADFYFGKNVGSLTLEECATLAGIPQAPSRFNPFRNPDLCLEKRNLVLERLLEEGYITRKEYDATIQKPLVLQDKDEEAQQVGGHFVDKVRQYLFKTYGEDVVRSSAWDVYTTLDVRYQRAAEEAVRVSLKEKDKTLGYRHYDCLSVYKSFETEGKQPPADLLETYEDPSWSRKPQLGINMRGLVMSVHSDHIIVRIKDHKLRLTQENMAWVGKILDMNKHFKVGDLPDFTLVTSTQDLTPDLPKETETEEELNAALNAAKPVMPRKAKGVDPSFPFKLFLDQEPDIEGAFLAIEPGSGDILAMVGAYDYRRSKFNRVDQARRQVGSVIKPVIYGAALEKGFTLADTLVDEPTAFWDPTQLQVNDSGQLEMVAPNSERAQKIRSGLLPWPKPYQPDNYYKSFDGKLTLRRALGKSTNVIAVKLLNSLGYDNVLKYADRLQILDKGDLQPYPSLALGALEITLSDMVYAYGTFAWEGIRYQPRYIQSIKDSKGLFIEKNDKKGEQIISPQNAFMLTSGLKEVIHGPDGTAKRARKLELQNIAGKTGTTNDYTNAWFIGYNRQITAGAWVGRDINHSIGNGSTGGSTALPVWLHFMEAIKDDLKDEPFPMPEGITTMSIDYATGKKITRDCDCDAERAIPEVFIRGTEPTEVCTKAEQDNLKLPWHVQKKSYTTNPLTQEILPTLEEINHASQLAALEFLASRRN